MQEKCEEMMREVDGRISAIDLNGKHIIKDCKVIIVFLREKLTGLKACVQASPFSDKAEEIVFFKCHKPMLLGRLIYFHEIRKYPFQCILEKDNQVFTFVYRPEDIKPDVWDVWKIRSTIV